MHLFMKFILAPVLFVLSVFVIIQTYRKYKIKHLLKKWEKKYHPFPLKRGCRIKRQSFLQKRIRAGLRKARLLV